jgi:hypothetical protein
MVAAVSLKGKGGEAVALEVLANFKMAASKSGARGSHHFEIISTIMKVQPRASLDFFLSGDAKNVEEGVRVIRSMARLRKNPLAIVEPADFIGWCEEQPEVRYSNAAKVVQFADGDGGGGSTSWTEVARQLLTKAPDRSAVLDQFARRFRPSGWTGSLAIRLEGYGKLLDGLDTFGDESFAASIAHQKASLAEQVKAQRELEASLERPRDETFE